MILIICEKNIAAERIAGILSDGNYKRSYIGNVPVYSYEKDGIRYSVIGLRGHIIEVDYPEEYNKWDIKKLRELINVQPVKKVTEYAIVGALKALARDAEKVIIATDFDREGELIGVEAIDLIRGINPDLIIKRARFSAITEDDVQKAFSNLVEVDFNLASAAEARQVVDLAWGAVLTRFLSLSSKQRGRDFLSAGRVQSPALKILVDREEEIENFVPKPYWRIEARLLKDLEFSAYHESGQMWDKSEAKRIMSILDGAKQGKVIECKKEDKKEYPPAPFNTTSFLQAATALGLSAQQAMNIAEELYTAGYISYPRTDSTVYPKSLGIYSILRRLIKSAFGKEAEELLENHRPYPTRGKTEATDHPPIHPVGIAVKEKLSKDEWNIYELVVRRFFATLAPDAVAEKSEVHISINGELFDAEGYKIIEQGWRKYYPYIRAEESKIPALSSGDLVDVLGINLKEDKTKPPKRYNQGTLIAEMDRLGLGTKSTRAEAVQKLYERRYVEGNITPTKIGIAVTTALKKYSPPVVTHEMTAELETEMDEIAQGRKIMEEVVEDSAGKLEGIVSEMERNIERIGEEIQKALVEQDVLGKCPECGSPMRIRRSGGGKRFLGCSTYPKCNLTYPLPQKGKIEYLGVCEECGAPRIKLITKGRKPWVICVNMECPTTKKRMETHINR